MNGTYVCWRPVLMFVNTTANRKPPASTVPSAGNVVGSGWWGVGGAVAGGGGQQEGRSVVGGKGQAAGESGAGRVGKMGKRHVQEASAVRGEMRGNGVNEMITR